MTSKSNFGANRYELNSINIISHDGSKVFNLFNLWTGLIIQEDIYLNSITGLLTIDDTVDLYNEFPFIGEEFIQFGFSVPDLGITNIELILAVNNITSPIVDPSHKTKLISFNLVSPEAAINASTTIARSTNNSEISSIVKEILTEDIQTKKALNVLSDTSKINAVFPNIHPFDAIKFLRRKSISKDPNDKSPWLFFERLNNSYVFSSINDLISQGLKDFDPDKHTLEKAIISESNALTYNPFTNIGRIGFDSNINKIGQLAEGELNSRTSQIDLLSKTVETFNFKYNDQFQDLTDSQMSPFKEFSNAFITNKEKSPGTTFLIHNDFNHSTGQEKNEPLGIQLGSKLAFLNSSDKGSITIELAGNPEWLGGQVIKLEIMKATGLEMVVTELDERISGFYCIEGVKHTFTRAEMITTIKVFSIGGKLNIEKILATGK